MGIRTTMVLGSEGIILICLELLILLFLFRRYRVKKNASWGKVVGILVIADILYFIPVYSIIGMYALSLRFGPM